MPVRSPGVEFCCQCEEITMTDIQSIIAKMTVEEKAALCTGVSVWTTQAVERLGVPEMVMSDGPHGLRRVPDVNSISGESLPATCFPTASSLASTWDIDLLREIGQALGEEAVALNADVILGPSNNMKLTPLCGRNFEYFSEDPYLSGQLAASHINGVQSNGVGTSLKHFAANNQEFKRNIMSAEVERDVRLQQAPRNVLFRTPRIAGRYSQRGMGLRRAGRQRLGRGA